MTDVTERDPTPHTHSADWGTQGKPGGEATRASAPARASFPSIPAVPQLLHTLFIGDGESSTRSFLAEFARRCGQRKDYALHGAWTEPNPPIYDEAGQVIGERILGKRWAYLLLYTVPIAWPIAFLIDFLDWATHPAGRLAATAAIFTLIMFIL